MRARITRFLSVALIAMSVFAASLAQAREGNGVGNGGDGVIIDGKVYPIDLIELNGKPVEPYFANRDLFVPEMVERFQNHSQMELEVLRLFSSKLIEIHFKNSLLELWLKDLFFRFHWNFVDAELKEDAKRDSVLTFRGLKVVRIATRKNIFITISIPFWKMMTDKAKVVLIYHELIDSLFESMTRFATSDISRSLVGVIFKDAFASYDVAKFGGVLSDHGFNPSDAMTALGNVRDLGKMNGEQITLLPNEVMVRRHMRAHDQFLAIVDHHNMSVEFPAILFVRGPHFARNNFSEILESIPSYQLTNKFLGHILGKPEMDFMSIVRKGKHPEFMINSYEFMPSTN